MTKPVQITVSSVDATPVPDSTVQIAGEASIYNHSARSPAGSRVVRAVVSPEEARKLALQVTAKWPLLKVKIAAERLIGVGPIGGASGYGGGDGESARREAKDAEQYCPPVGPKEKSGDLAHSLPRIASTHEFGPQDWARSRGRQLVPPMRLAPQRPKCDLDGRRSSGQRSGSLSHDGR